MRMRFGVHAALEAEADRLLKESLVDVKSHQAKSDILTPWKLQDRRRREVMVSTGTPDPAIRSGMFHRRLNPQYPHLNSRGGVYPAMRDTGLRAFMDENRRDFFGDG